MICKSCQEGDSSASVSQCFQYMFDFHIYACLLTLSTMQQIGVVFHRSKANMRLAFPQYG